MKNEKVKLPVAKSEGMIIDDNPEKEEHIYFHLKDSTHEFTMGLKEILTCLKFAEDEGLVPELPRNFWSSMEAEYFELSEQYSPNFKEGYYNGFWNALQLAMKESQKGRTAEEVYNDKRFSNLTSEELIGEISLLEEEE